jgi:hypothetical protein
MTSSAPRGGNALPEAAPIRRMWLDDHWAPMSLFVVASLWMMRNVLFSHGLPAGTDMFDLIARVHQNAHWDTLASPWSPSGLGLPRQMSMDNILGLLALTFGGAVGTVKIVMFILLFGAGAGAYWLSWKWYHARLAATVAGVIYMLSQAILGRMASGWLHYEALMALAPMLIYLWVTVVDRFSWRHSLLLALTLSALVLLRVDMVLWLLPYLGIYVVVAALMKGFAPIARNFLRVVAVVVPAMLLLTSYLTVPLATGVKAPWLSVGQVFLGIRLNLLDRSLTAYQSLLGLGRDMGYLPFSGQEWWSFHPDLPLLAYYAAASVVVGCAYWALTLRRDRHTVLLLVSAVVGPFLGKGIRGPVGGPYWWAVERVPGFGNLRGPNRWLMMVALAYAVLAGLTVQAGISWAREKIQAHKRSPRWAYAGAAALMAVILLPTAPTIASGFLAWRPTTSQVRLMRPIAQDHSTFLVASVPYDQPQMFVSDGSYSGWEHDLGVESALWTDHPTLSNNTWSQPESNFVDYTQSLLQTKDPAFTQLLGSIGVKYLLKFNYPPTAAWLSTGDPGTRYYQQQAVKTMSGLHPVATTAGGSLFALPAASPMASFRSNIAVVLGGSSGLADFASLPGINVSDWATFTAGDLLTGPGGSESRLLHYMRIASLIVVTDDTIQDLSVLASRPIARVPGVRSAVGTDQAAGLLLTDESVRRGALTDKSLPPAPLTASSETTFRVSRPERLEVWARVLFSQSPGQVSFTVDGREVKSIVPLTPGQGDFRWVRVASSDFAPGSHQVGLEGSLSQLGGTFEVNETRVISPASRKEKAVALSDALDGQRDKVAYSLNLATAPYSLSRPAPLRDPGAIGEQADPEFWDTQSAVGTDLSVVRDSSGSFQRLELSGTRQYYTVVHHDFPRRQSWEQGNTLLVRYRGVGSGSRYDFIVDFSRDHEQFRSIPLVDSSPGWQTAAIRIDGPGGWNHVVGLRISSPSKSAPGQIDLRPPSWLFPGTVSAQRRLVAGVSQDARLIGWPSTDEVKTTMTRAPGAGSILRTSLPTALTNETIRLTLVPRDPPVVSPAIPVPLTSSGIARSSFAFDAPTFGVLVFNQSTDPNWTLTTKGRVLTPVVPVAGLTNGYFLPAGRHSGNIGFAGRRITDMTALFALVAHLSLAAVTVGLFARSRRQHRRERAFGVRATEEEGEGHGARDGGGRFRTTARRVSWGVAASAAVLLGIAFRDPFLILLSVGGLLLARSSFPWRRLLTVALVGLAAASVLAALNLSYLADRLAVVVLVVVLIATIMAVREDRRAWGEPVVASPDATWTSWRLRTLEWKKDHRSRSAPHTGSRHRSERRAQRRQHVRQE